MFVVEPSNQEVVPMETNQRPYESTRPERPLRLNQSLYDMIQRPLHLTHNRRYRDYRQYALQGPQLLALEGPEPQNYPIVPYRRYNEFSESNRCQRCQRTFDSRELLQNHRCTQCSECEEIFHSHAALQEHSKNCKPSVYACAICGKNNPSKSAWRSHVKAMHQTRIDLEKTKKNNK